MESDAPNDREEDQSHHCLDLRETHDSEAEQNKGKGGKPRRHHVNQERDDEEVE